MKSEILMKHVLSFESENLPSPPRCRDFKFCILLDNINLFSLFDSWHADKIRLAPWAPVGSKYEFPISSVRRRRFIPNNPTGFPRRYSINVRFNVLESQKTTDF